MIGPCWTSDELSTR